MKLNELFELDRLKAPRYDRVGSSLFADFYVDNMNYTVVFMQASTPGHWEMEFKVNPKYGDANSMKIKDEHGIINSGKSPYQIFAHVLTILNNFLEKHKPKLVEFEAIEPSRIKLYDKLTRRFRAESFGYTIETETTEDNSKVYSIIRSNNEI